MAREIERKFLLTSDAWRPLASPPGGVLIRQGYIATGGAGAGGAWGGGGTVRVRIAGDQAFLTIKGPSDPAGLARDEYEYPIPVKDAGELLDRLCRKPLIEKRRHRVGTGAHGGVGGGGGGGVWEIDEFLGENAGLIVAEIELASEDQAVEIPAWIGAEVTTDPRYRNSNLVERPYSQWRAGSP